MANKIGDKRSPCVILFTPVKGAQGFLFKTREYKTELTTITQLVNFLGQENLNSISYFPKKGHSKESYAFLRSILIINLGNNLPLPCPLISFVASETFSKSFL